MKITGKSYVSRYSHVGGEGVEVSKQVLTGVLKTFYGVQDEKLGEILADGRTPEEIQNDLAELDRNRVKSLTAKLGTDKYQEGYKKAKAEERAAAEVEFKQHFGIESDLKGAELVAHIVAEKMKEAGATGEDAIRKSPTYAALERKMKEEVSKVQKEYEQKITGIQSTIQKEKTMSFIGSSALEIINGKNPIVSKSQVVANTHRNNFINELAGYEYTIGEDGKIVTAISKNGTVLDDGHGNNLQFDTFVNSIAERHFEFSANNGGANGGNANDGGTGTGAYPAGIKKPTNEAELTALLSNYKLSAADRRVIADEYKKRMSGK